METSISRRGFIAGAATMGAGALAGSTVAVAGADETTDIAWEAEADIVIVGGGVAGFSALATVAYENLGTALLLEAADEVEMGGNSRVCGQGVFCPKTVEAAIAYQTKCNGSYVVPEELMQSWAENICENVDWMVDALGFDPVEKGGAEFPEYDETGDVVWYAHEGKGPWAHTWQLFVDLCTDYDMPVYCNARAVDLVRDQATGEICGVATEDGRCFKANKGVILACGGFENNMDMMNTYMEIGFPGYYPQGTPWNRGDGVKMAMSAGADLWHMNNVSGNALEVRCISNDDQAISSLSFASDDFIYISGDGTRFKNEDESARHGKVYRAGTWAGMTMPEVAWCIMTENAMQNSTCGSGGYWARTDGYEVKKSGPELLDAGIIVKCETAADIAAATGIDEAAIAATLETYNGYTETGVDLDFHRERITDADNPAFANTSDNPTDVVLEPIEAPYYVVRLYGSVLNTQGGPKRSALGEVVDVKGNPIPRLYAAGEMGCIYGYAYNLGGNFSEAISSGRLAARSCSALDPIA